ncbi:alpha/beta hydrolase [Pseudorhizobium xiangyangii]|uniref:alpha/beta hydrolase n=1 Tax=Pseudorhizobium xiangyangii TaxID=2883104 RepID=UPI0036F3F9B4
MPPVEHEDIGDEMRHRIADWDDAYANGPNIAGGDRWPGLWVEPARLYREALAEAGHAELDIPYGGGERNRLDLFMPASAPIGLVVFVHGGFWLRLDKSYWSHLARGAVEHGYAVAIPSYTLCPEIRLSGITTEIGIAIEKAAELVGGPIRLVGHSAGGQLVTRMISMTSPLPETIRLRIAHTVSLSGLHDLRPLMHIAMNAQLQIDRQEAWRESPALLEPMHDARLTCWVGAAERSEFIRQNALLANIWKGLAAETSVVEEPDRHHFNVLDGLADPHHPLTQALLS